jgi:hypothetical protein
MHVFNGNGVSDAVASESAVAHVALRGGFGGGLVTAETIAPDLPDADASNWIPIPSVAASAPTLIAVPVPAGWRWRLRLAGATAPTLAAVRIAYPATDAIWNAPLGALLRAAGGAGGSVSIANFPAAQAVTGPLTDAQLRAAVVPVLARAADGVLVSGSVTSSATLFTQDCAPPDAPAFNSVAVQITNPGTGCTVAYEVSNDGSTWSAVTGSTPLWTAASAGNNPSTSNAAVLLVFPALARFFRARVSVYGSGTVTAVAIFRQDARPITTMNAGLVATTAVIGDVGLQLRATATGAAAIHHVIAGATTNAAVVKAAAGRLVGWCFGNAAAAWRYVKLHNIATAPTAGAGVVLTIPIPPNGLAQHDIPAGIGFSTGIGRTVVAGLADADATAVAAGDVVGDLFFA